MVEAAVAEVAGLVAGRLEIDLGGPSYTADTLERLAEGVRRRRALHDRRRRRGGRAHDVGSGTRRSSTGRARGRRPAGRAGRTARRRRLDPGRGAPARGVEHRPAGPVLRRPPARLPRHRTGARRDRRCAASTGGTSDGIGVAARRRATVIALVATTVAIVVAGSAHRRRSGDAARLRAGRQAADTVPELRLPVTPTALIGVVDDANVLTSVVALVLAPNGVGGSIVVLPATGDSSLGLGDDRFSLAETYAVRGPEAFAARGRGARRDLASTSSRWSTRRVSPRSWHRWASSPLPSRPTSSMTTRTSRCSRPDR